MDTAEALGLTRHLLEGMCEIRLDPLSFTRKDELIYERLCWAEDELLSYQQSGAPAPVEVLRRVERVLTSA